MVVWLSCGGGVVFVGWWYGGGVDIVWWLCGDREVIG